MGRKQKRGIDYAGWSVNIFDGDAKIDKLLEAQGWQGFSIYFYLCQMAYKFDGYFYKWSYDDSTTTARRMGGGIRSETVKATVNTCFRVGLFHKGLFEKYGILTSRGIQRKYYTVVQSRRVRTVNADFWLLDAEESAGLSLQRTNADLQGTNAGLQAANADLQAANSIGSKVKERKEEEKKREEKEIPPSLPPPPDLRVQLSGGTISPYPAEVKVSGDYFEENFNVRRSMPLINAITNSLLDGASVELIRAVIDDAALAHARQPDLYVKKILEDLLREKVRDLSAYHTRSEEFRKRKGRKPNGDDGGNTDSAEGWKLPGGTRL